ncbi:hypothetical protein CPB83DRAFT_843760 [Crepidotus variabilis]|uniref:Uncharacterized protein n=1 Tax=Crepidotus variabilis TaxID=179855 RepID=A0A9P6ESD2_9AGAR|nr:hypothetical protein CPB83DRAFT_843760 [Crepidotus variabilis]
MKFVSFALSFACFMAKLNVNAAPLPLSVHFIHPSLISKTDQDFLKAAATRATEILSRVSQVIKNKDKNILPIILGSKDWENSEYLAQLDKNVHTLAAGVVPIFYSGQRPPTVPGSDQTVAAWDTREKQLMIFDTFYQGHDTQTAAFNLIHEASHALLQTADHFSRDGRFTPISHIPGGGEEKDYYRGYVWHADFRSLRQLGGAKIMLKNADTYLLLSHLAVNGLVDYKTSPMKNWSITGSGAITSASSSGIKRTRGSESATPTTSKKKK